MSPSHALRLWFILLSYALPSLSDTVFKGPSGLSPDMWEIVTPVPVTISRPRDQSSETPEEDTNDYFTSDPRFLIGDHGRRYRFTAFGQHFYLNLRCHDNFLPRGLMVQELGTNFTRLVPVRFPSDQKDCFYTGNVIGDSKSTVALSLCHGLMGHIRTSRGRFFIEPLTSHSSTFTANSPGAHVIYRHRNHANHCSLQDSPVTNSTGTIPKHNVSQVDYERHQHSHIRKRRSASMDLHIEVMVVVDSKMHQYHGQNLHHYVLTLMSIVARLYKDPSIGNSLTLEVVKLMVVDKEFDREILSTNAEKTLRNFCKWQATLNDPDENSPNHYDTAILLTREDICRTAKKCDTLGLSKLGTICDPLRSCAIVEDNGLSAAFTIAHELGHALNMPHDDEPLKCRRFNQGNSFHIMTRMLDYSTYPWSWSACSAHYLTEFLDAGSADCLLNEPVVNKLRGRYGEDQQPGKLFGKDKQCELIYGQDAKICPYMPVCKLLWCTTEEHFGCITRHMPWADGTPCGDSKWCHRGECKKIQRHAPIDGRWGRWGKFGSCSRPCGGGIMKQIRECTRPKPRNGGKYCIGKRIRYRSCNTLSCPPGMKDFREEQCASYNGISFEQYGLPANVSWVPVFTEINTNDRCKLFCRHSNDEEPYNLREKVIDGTPCGPETFDICVNGICNPAGCDHVLGSNKKLDVCGVCGGNNSTCNTFSE